MKHRNLILGERIMYVNAETPVNCVSTARLRGHLTLEGLAGALLRIQHRHPLLQASIHEDRRHRPYFATGTMPPPIPIHRVDRLSDDHWLSVSEQEWKRPFDLRTGPLARVIWLSDITVSELLLVSPHCVADGMTCITLLRELLEGLDKPAEHLPGYASFAHIRDIIPSSVLKGRRQKLKTVLTSLFIKTVFSLKPAPRFVHTGKDYALHWKLNAKATSLLEEHCRAKGVSVYPTLCVAFLESFLSIRKGRGRNKLLCPVDIRKMVPAIKDDMMFAFAPIIELSIDKDPEQDSTSFWDKARQIKNDIATKVAAIDAYEMLLSGENFQPCARKLIKHLIAEEGNHDFTFSNLGRLNLPTTYRHFELETIYSSTVAFPWRNPNTLVVSTFNGQMDFTFISNTQSLRYEEAIDFKGKAIARLLEELALVNAFRT